MTDSKTFAPVSHIIVAILSVAALIACLMWVCPRKTSVATVVDGVTGQQYAMTQQTWWGREYAVELTPVLDKYGFPTTD